MLSTEVEASVSLPVSAAVLSAAEVVLSAADAVLSAAEELLSPPLQAVRLRSMEPKSISDKNFFIFFSLKLLKFSFHNGSKSRLFNYTEIPLHCQEQQVVTEKIIPGKLRGYRLSINPDIKDNAECGIRNSEFGIKRIFYG